MAVRTSPTQCTHRLQSTPNPVDPRGLLTFGLTGLALIFLGVMIARSERLPRWLGYLGCLNGVLLVVLYLGRLLILDPANPLIVIPALLTGFLLNPLWYAWLGVWSCAGGPAADDPESERASESASAWSAACPDQTPPDDLRHRRVIEHRILRRPSRRPRLRRR
jgi:hypothetical protein